MFETKLIPGFRFHPTDVELVKYFLKRKVLGKKFPFDVIAELDIYKYAPWDLPDKSLLKFGDLEWYFFCPRRKKCASGKRMKRETKFGNWRATGAERSILHDGQIVGMVKTLIFYQRQDTDRVSRTDWVMYEFRLKDKEPTDKGIHQDSYVICKVFHKEGLGPRNGAQYGKPFNEEDWDEDTDEVDNPGQANNAEGGIREILENLRSFLELDEDGHTFSFDEKGGSTTNEMLSINDILKKLPEDLESALFWNLIYLIVASNLWENNQSKLHSLSLMI